jgi:ketosteroid isomerase-like protein
MATGNAERVRKAYSDFNAGRIGDVLALLDENVEWDEPGWLFMPRARYQGPAAVRRGVFETVPQYWDSLRLEPDEFLGFADRVLARGKFVGRLKGARDEIEVPYLHLWTLRGGKIVKGEAFIDVSEIQPALERQRAA